MTNSITPEEGSIEERRMRPFTVTFDEKRSGYFVVGSGFDLFFHFTSGGENALLECDHVLPHGAPESFSCHIVLPLWNGVHNLQLVETWVYRELVSSFPEQFKFR